MAWTRTTYDDDETTDEVARSSLPISWEGQRSSAPKNSLILGHWIHPWTQKMPTSSSLQFEHCRPLPAPDSWVHLTVPLDSLQLLVLFWLFGPRFSFNPLLGPVDDITGLQRIRFNQERRNNVYYKYRTLSRSFGVKRKHLSTFHLIDECYFAVERAIDSRRRRSVWIYVRGSIAVFRQTRSVSSRYRDNILFFVTFTVPPAYAAW